MTSAGTTTGKPDAAAVPDTPAPRRSVGRWAPAGLVTLVTVAALLATGTPVLDVASYAAYLGGAVLLPGTLVYRALRGQPRTLVEDLAAGAATGFALELAAWTLYGAAGLSGWLWSWPLLVVVPFAAVPALRRHWWPRGYAPVPTGWAWAVAAVAAVVVGYLWISYLALNPVTPDAPLSYYQDLLYHLSLAAEAKHHFPLQIPQVAGEPLRYHWFTDAHLASASLISGVDLPTVLFRLYLLPIALASVVLLALAGWRVSGRPYAGAVAAALVFAIGELKLVPGFSGTFGTVFTFTGWASPSMTYSYLFLFPLVFLMADRLAGRPGARGGWALIGLFIAASTGAKSSTIPVLLAGAVLVFGAELLRRRISWPALAAAGALIGGQLFATAVLLGGQSYGIAVDPFRMVTKLPFAAAALAPDRPAWRGAVVFGAAVALWGVVLFARLAGIPALLRRKPGPVELFLLGGFVAGIGAALVFDHPGGSEAYFLKTAWPLGAILSAWGFVELAEERRVPRWLGWALGGVLTAASAVLVVVTSELWPPVRATGAGAVTAAARPLLALAAVGLVAAAGWWIVRRIRPELRGTGAVVAVAAVLAAGAANVPIEVTPTVEGLAGDRLPAVSPTGVSPSMVAAAQWVRDHSQPSDVVATNVHCQNRSAAGLVGADCDSRAFWVSGFTERRVLVESWGYTDRIVGSATRGGVHYTRLPFWDGPLLTANDAAFTDPTPQGLAALRDEHHVRWLVADRRAEISPALTGLATLRYRGADADVYELPGR
jgi:hypothetical protein